MLEAVTTDLVFTISLKRSTQNLQLSTSWAGRLHHLWARTLKRYRPLSWSIVRCTLIRIKYNDNSLIQHKQKSKSADSGTLYWGNPIPGFGAGLRG
jgi:hypothetical protein